jgi:PAS domain S-box-containing protein
MTARHSIFRQLLLLALALVAPLIIFIGWGIYTQFQGDLRDELQNLRRLRQFAEKEIHSYIEATRVRLERLGQGDTLQQLQPVAIEAELRNFARINPEYANLALLDPEGRVVAAASIRPADPNLSLARHSPFDAALASPGFFVSPVFKGEVTGRPSVLLAQPVLGPDGRRLGTLAVPLNLPELSRMLTYDPTESRVLVTVLDRSGAVVMRSFEAEKYIGQVYASFSILQERARQSGESSGELPGLNGEPRVFDTSAVPGTPWLVTVSEPSAMVFADARRNVWRALLLVAAVLLFVLVLLFYYARGLAGPIAALAEAARAQAAGRLAATAPESGPAEIVQTARAFNEMVAFRQRAELSLQQSEHRYRTVIEQTGQMVFDYDVARDQVTWYGRTAIEQITGRTLEEINGTGLAGWQDLLHPDDRAAAAARLRNCLVTGEPCSAEYRLRHKDGSYRMVEERSVVLRDGGNAFTRMLGRMSDITERRRDSEILQQERQLLRQIIDLVPHFIFAKDKEGRYILANQASADVYNTTIENLVGKTDADLAQNKEEAMSFLTDDAEVIRSGRPKVIAEERITDARGRVRYLNTVKIPFRFTGESDLAVLGVSVDFTELKEAELARQQIEKKLLETQKLESLGVLAGGIAHDFNNLLTGILGNAGLARLDRPAGTRGNDYLEQIEKAALRAAELCKQMLAYSGKGSFIVQRLDLNDLLDDTLQLLQISVSKRALLYLNLTRPLPPVQADASQIRQVLMNLVVNASEALDERAGTITLGTGRLNADAAYLSGAHFSGPVAPGPYVYVEVSDNGIGMNPEILNRIFDPFFTTKFTGRGLGLAAVLGIVRAHRGAIKVFSEAGRGTTFKILLPATDGAAQQLAPRPAAAGPWRGSGRVLVVDDEESVRRVAARMLQKLGFTVDTAADGHEALLLFESAATEYTIVLLDLTMPRLDGEETFRRLRQVRPGIRVVLMSGFNKVDTVDRFAGQGLAGFVQKPFEIDSLTAEIRRVLESGLDGRT